MKIKIVNLILLATLISCNLKNSSANQSEDTKENIELLNEKEAKNQNKSDDNLGALITTIKFGIKADKEQVKDFPDGVIPWISIENPEREKLIDANEVVIESNEIIVNIDYPLNKPAQFTLKSPAGFTKKQLIFEISKKYKEIYNEEEKTAKTKTVPIEKRKGIINRNETDGIYGIWGHDIGDLDLSSIDVYKTKDGKIAIQLGIES
jgi:hypothetical protein